MARRSRSSLHPLWLLAGAFLIAVLFAIGSYFLGQTGDPYRTTPPLETAAYLENSNSLRGNTYRVTGEIQNVLGYSQTLGRLISVKVEDREDVIPMLIPSDLGEVNIQKGQKFLFLIDVTEKGILRAKALTKA